MPSFYKMSGEKNDEIPVVVDKIAPSTGKAKNTKKYVIIAVSAILGAVIILTAILVGMYMFTEAQKEIIQYTLKMSENMKQDVTSDPNENVVQYHVSSPGHEAWIINDFGKDLQVTKVVSDGKTNCFVSPLNRTNLLDPAKINGPESTNVNQAESLTYIASDTPISDTSFLGKTAKDTCKGVSVYWLYPQCTGKNSGKDANITDVDNRKSKRQTTVDNSPYYVKTYSLYKSSYDGQYYYVPCFTGCCRKVCACSIDYTYYYSNGVVRCNWVLRGCVQVPYYWDWCVDGPSGLECPNYSSPTPPTC